MNEVINTPQASTITTGNTASAPKHLTTPAHLDAVEGLRGIAALVIVVYHCFTTSDNPEWRPIAGINVLRVFHDGWSGVNLFLVLSGFCLFWPLARNPARTIHYGEFMQKRVRRIVPAYYASLIIASVFSWLLNRSGLWHNPAIFMPAGKLDVLLHLFLLHSFSAEAFRSWNGVAWSLGLEWTWYLFFPFAVLLFRHWGPARTVSLCAIVTVGYCCACYAVFGPTRFLQENFAFTVRSFLPARLLEFSLGMSVAWLLANRRVSSELTFWAACSVIPLLILAHEAEPVDVWYPVRNILYGIASAAMLLAALGTNLNPVHWVCRLRWLQKVGQWSYSLYLFHLPVLIVVSILLTGLGLKGPLRFAASLLSLPVVIMLSKWEFLAFEQPFFTRRQRQEHSGSATRS